MVITVIKMVTEVKHAAVDGSCHGYLMSRSIYKIIAAI